MMYGPVVAQTKTRRPPSALSRFLWGVEDTALRLLEYGGKMLLLSLVAVALLVAAAVFAWGKFEDGVSSFSDYVDEQNQSTTTVP